MLGFNKEPAKVALVLGGGATRGVAHIGVIAALEEHNIPIDLVVGTSAGSLIGCFYAAGFSAKSMTDFAKQINAKQIKSSFVPFVPSKTEGLQQLIIKFMGNKNIEDLPIPFCAVSVDVKTGKEIHFTKGSVSKAVAGSCAVPGVFMPVEYDDYLLYDGGLTNNLPANVPATLMQNIKVISVDVNSTRGSGTDSTKVLDTIMASISIMMKANSGNGYVYSDIMIKPDLKRFKSTKLEGLDEMILEGYNAAIFAMDKIKKIISGKSVEERKVNFVGSRFIY